MFVTEVSIGKHNLTPETARDETIRQRSEGKGQNAVEQLRVIAGLCNSGDFEPTTNNLPLSERKIIGDATDQAILRLSESLGPVTELRQLWRKTFELAFNSKNKFMIRTLSLLDSTGRSLALSPSEASEFTDDDT
jgi:sodium/potassium-transporting ATPase subunit alpha